jgi:hypothetical protein
MWHPIVPDSNNASTDFDIEHTSSRSSSKKLEKPCMGRPEPKLKRRHANLTIRKYI